MTLDCDIYQPRHKHIKVSERVNDCQNTQLLQQVIQLQQQVIQLQQSKPIQNHINFNPSQLGLVKSFMFKYD